MCNRRLDAFSLIELMVVIAIVALLAAVATPAYMKYITNAKYASAYAASSSFFEKVNQYFTKTGNFPTSVAELGYTPEAGIPTDTLMPTSVSGFVIPPYVMIFSLASHNSATPGTCENFVVQAYVNNVDKPFQPGLFDGTLQINHLVFETNGVLRKLCIYNYIVNGTYVPNPDISIAGCLEETTNTTLLTDLFTQINALCP